MEDWKTGGKLVDASQVTFGKVGDFIKGTYTGKKIVSTSNGETPLYELRAHIGSFHTVDDKKNPIEPSVNVEPGAYYNVWGSLKSTSGAYAITGLFDKVKLGEVVSIEFVKETPSKTKGNAPFKKFETLEYGPDLSFKSAVEQAEEAFPGSEPIEE